MMARLNEPPVAPDSLEILRRRFLRQNRDIAKINSAQSLKIRVLENECARLLSENLDLRGQIIRLEEEVERNSAQRIADHALEIKAKMEAQLEEWGAMLAGLGVEPPAKRRSLEKRKSPKSRLSASRSPPQRRRRNTGVDLDALAAQEGRLPPIYEQKAYPRATMNSEEILALCSEAADTSGNSPDLGPPPVSRYVEEDPVKINSPSPKNTNHNPEVQIKDSSEAPEDDEFTPRRLEYGKKLLNKPDLSPKRGTDLASSRQPVMVEEEMNPSPQRSTEPLSAPITTTKASTKRKYGDENENSNIGKSQGGKENGPLQSRRVIKEIPSSRRDKAGQVKAGPLVARPPLAAKSTNEDVSSPRKTSKEPGQDDQKLAKSQAAKEALPKEKAITRERLAKIEIPQPEPVPELAIMPEPDTPFSPPIASPDTPVCSAQRSIPHDTPPPSDIDSNGEATRPSRRARAAVSYAEPSLRVKMRRPTKELFDAVSGEGKFIQRSAPQNAGGSATAPNSSTKVKTEADSCGSNSWKSLHVNDQVSRRQSAMSPLAPKTTTSSASGEEEVSLKRQEHNESANPVDIYDFAPSSPAASESKQQQVGESTKTNSKSRNPRRTSAAVSSSSRQTAAEDAEYVPDASVMATGASSSKSRASHPRKRASMVVPKKTTMAELLNLEEGEAGEGDVSIESVSSTGSGSSSKISAKDKVTRRRSMML